MVSCAAKASCQARSCNSSELSSSTGEVITFKKRSQASIGEMLPPPGVELVVDLEVPTDVVLKRLASRRVCVECGTNYSLERPPSVDEKCDVCGGEVRRLLSAAPFILKGGGWYVTDYPSESRKKALQSEKSSEKTTDKPADKPGDKPAEKPAAKSESTTTSSSPAAPASPAPPAPKKSD